MFWAVPRFKLSRFSLQSALRVPFAQAFQLLLESGALLLQRFDPLLELAFAALRTPTSLLAFGLAFRAWVLARAEHPAFRALEALVRVPALSPGGAATLLALGHVSAHLGAYGVAPEVHGGATASALATESASSVRAEVPAPTLDEALNARLRSVISGFPMALDLDASLGVRALPFDCVASTALVLAAVALPLDTVSTFFLRPGIDGQGDE